MNFFARIMEFVESTQVPAQFRDVDASGLFTNPWFVIPFIVLVGYMLYRQAIKDLVLLAMGIVVWYVSGTEYMHTLSVDGELQLEKVLPVVFGSAVMLGIVIYMFFGRSD